MKYVLFYDPPFDLALARRLFSDHRARFEAFQAAGTLLMIGRFADSPQDGAMAIFTSRDAAEEFARGDPFVVQGVVGAWRIRTWNEALTAP